MNLGDESGGATTRVLLKICVGLAAVALLVAWIVSRVAVCGDDATITEKETFGHLTALLVLALFTLVIYLVGRRLGGLILGVDGRVSTSKLQVLIWTYAIGGTLMSLIAETWVGIDTGFDKLSSTSFEDFGPYLILLGGPLAAAVGARAIVGAQVENGDKAKPPGDPKVGQAFTDDKGDADLVDCQYLLFNLIAVIYFLGAFIESPAGGLPQIPTVLYVLTGASALAYVSNKAVPSGPPTIASISPSTGSTDTQVTVFGSGLLFPLNPTATTAPTTIAEFHPVEAMIGGRQAAIVDGTLASSGAGGDRFQVTVPAGLEIGQEHDVVALNFRGTRTEPVKFKRV